MTVDGERGELRVAFAVALSAGASVDRLVEIAEDHAARVSREAEQLREALDVARRYVHAWGTDKAERQTTLDVIYGALARGGTPAGHEAFCAIYFGSVTCNCGVALGGVRASAGGAGEAT